MHTFISVIVVMFAHRLMEVNCVLKNVGHDK